MLNSLLAQGGFLLPQMDLSDDPMAVPRYLDPNASGFTGVDPSGMNAQRRALLDLLAQMPQQRQMPGAVAPAWRTQDVALGAGLPLLLGLLGGKKGWQGAGQYVQGYLGGKMQKADMDTQTAQRTAEMDNRNAMEMWKGRVGQASQSLEFANQDFNRAYGESQADKAANNRINLESLKAQFKAQSEMAKAQHREDIEAKKALYRNLGPEARRRVAEAQGYDKATADALAEITAEEEHTAAKTQNVVQDTALDQKRFEMDAKKSNEMISLAKQRLKRDLDKDEQQTINERARIEVMRKNAATSARNADTSRMNLEFLASAGALNGKIDSDIAKAEADIIALRAEQKSLSGVLEADKRKTIEADIQGKRAKINHWKSLKVADVADPAQTGAQGKPDWRDESVNAVAAIRLGKDPAAVRAAYEKRTGRKANF